MRFITLRSLYTLHMLLGVRFARWHFDRLKTETLEALGPLFARKPHVRNYTERNPIESTGLESTAE